jgi:Xaa-Pro aminopeptidase
MLQQPYAKRRTRLAEVLRERGLGAAAILPGPSFYYFTGLHFLLLGRPTMIVVTADGELLALLPELERLKWLECYRDTRTFFWQDSDGYQAAFDALVRTLGPVRLGIESRRMRAFEADEFRRRLGNDALTDVERILERQRMIKDAAELDCIERAIAITQCALGETLELIRTGQTELDVQKILSIRMLEGGADGLGFEPLVLFGSNAANPHGTSGNRPLRPGDPILIDCSARIQGYHSALSCSAFCEYATDEHAKIHQAVVAASKVGLGAVEPGMTAHQLNGALMDSLRSSGFADMIVHRGGHGLGLAIHEAPYIQENEHEVLPEGAVVLLEPALYRQGEIGVRLEDVILVQAGASRALTNFSRELKIVGK